MKKWALFFWGAVLLTSCAAPQQIDYETVQFRGDTSPKITSSQFISNKFTDLNDGEAVVLALAPDGSGAASQPYSANINIVETVLGHNKKRDTLENIKTKCDVDNDGIWDRYCPELSRIRGKLENYKFVTFQSQYFVSHKKASAGQWVSAVTLDRLKPKTGTDPISLRLFSINRGNKPFKGDLKLAVSIPPQVNFQKIKQIKRIKDQRSTKQTMMMLPIIQYLAMTMADYPLSEIEREIDQKWDEEGRLILTVKNISLKPNEGVSLDYIVNYRLEE